MLCGLKHSCQSRCMCMIVLKCIPHWCKQAACHQSTATLSGHQTPASLTGSSSSESVLAACCQSTYQRSFFPAKSSGAIRLATPTSRKKKTKARKMFRILSWVCDRGTMQCNAGQGRHVGLIAD